MRLDAKVVGLDKIGPAMAVAEKQARFATAIALSKVATAGQEAVRAEMPNVFDRPTPWVLNSLRVKRATKANLVAEVGYKDRNSVESSRSMIEPHVDGGARHHKVMEVRLFRAGMLPKGWSAVPGQSAKLDAFGNMSQGQITTILNVLGTYREAGYNKANAKTVARLAKGNVKKNVYGFTYWVNSVGGKAAHLQPGVYQRFTTAFGTSLKPVLIFVQNVSYRKRLDFYGKVNEVVEREFSGAFDVAFADAMRTAFPEKGGVL